MIIKILYIIPVFLCVILFVGSSIYTEKKKRFIVPAILSTIGFVYEFFYFFIM